MRHRKKFNHLGRKSEHRLSLLSNLSGQLIVNKRIVTTVAKAKALRPYLEPIISKSKENTTHNRRMVFSYLKDKLATKELFETVAPAIGDRPGGYTRIIKAGFRKGDNAELAYIELVDFNNVYTKVHEATDDKKKTRRSRRKKKTDDVEDVSQNEETNLNESNDISEPNQSVEEN
ncbi:MAG: 50S ribosomal protein L17 [Chitinophagales bacterium]|nr:50S ribosomal protein L17 [Chitinophagales bacterium]